MLRHRLPFHLLLWAAIVLAFGAFSDPAWAAISGIDKGIINGGSADFGSGSHSLGSPTQPYDVEWDYSVDTTGRLFKTAHVIGYLYVDNLFGPGYARLKVLYQNAAGSTVASQTLQFFGPGFDANNQANQLKVDVSKGGTDIARVRLITGFGSTTSTIQDTGFATWNEPQVAINDTLTNGDWTFQENGSGFGTNFGVNIRPVDDLMDMEGVAQGFLTASNFSFVPRLIVDFLDSSGSLLDHQVWDNSTFDPGLTSFGSTIFKIRVTLEDVFLSLVSKIVSRTYSLGPAVGDAECVPFATTAVVNDLSTASLRWTVPGTASWHSLDSVDIRLIDDAGAILQVRWNEALNEFLFYDPDSGQFRGHAAPGSNERFERPEVAMLLADTQVVGSGPLGPSVFLNLGLQFKPKAAGRIFQVEARASDKSDTAQGWVPAGTITVLPKN